MLAELGKCELLRSNCHAELQRPDLGLENLADLVVIVTDHSAFDYETIVRHARRVLDTRNATKGVKGGRSKIVKL